MIAEHRGGWAEGQSDEKEMTVATLFWGVLFGSIGLGFFLYGKKQRAIVPLVCGVALMVFPYFVSSTAWLVIAGLLLIAAPYFFRV